MRFLDSAISTIRIMTLSEAIVNQVSLTVMLYH